jgi:aspartyl protease family protein
LERGKIGRTLKVRAEKSRSNLDNPFNRAESFSQHGLRHISGAPMLRLAFSMLIATITVAFLAGAVINGKLRIPLTFPHAPQAVAAQEPSAVVLPPVPTPVPAPAPVDAISNSDDESYEKVEVERGSSGGYETDIEIRDRAIHVEVDTGASYFSLTPDDAEKLGFYLDPTDFKYRFSTAAGTVFYAKVHIDRVWIGNFEIDNVDAYVSPPHALRISLLGMNVLSRLSSVHISDGRLVLQR